MQSQQTNEPHRELPPRHTGGILATRLPMPGGWELSFGQVALMAGMVFYSLVTPGDFKYKLDVLGFGVCHQLHTHSFYIAGHQLPLCARCTGMYLGALATVGLLVFLRRKAVRLPVRPLGVILGCFFAVMVLDGINSTLQTFGGGVWETTNLLRIITGALSGIAIGFIFYPIFNVSLWSPKVARRERVLEQPFELIAYLIVTGVLVALVLDGGDWLYYPIAILSIGGMLTLLTMANAMIVLIVTRREATFSSLSTALTPILLGLFIGLIELTLLAWGRASLAPLLVNNGLGLPLTPGLP